MHPTYFELVQNVRYFIIHWCYVYEGESVFWCCFQWNLYAVLLEIGYILSQLLPSENVIIFDEPLHIDTFLDVGRW